jgi:gamma-glutamylcyclotransferase (GGCT)/AIG2-like uncharacterized protein YtfP
VSEEKSESEWEKDDIEYVDVFVYGTLMKGFGNHFFLQNDVFLGYGETKPEYTLYDLGHFPAMVDGGETSVKGEIYEADPRTVEWMDKLEGVEDGLYEKKEIILTDGGKVLVYIFPRENLRPTDVPIKSGKWVPKLKIRVD